MSIESTVIEFLEQTDNESQGHAGVLLPIMAHKLKLSYSELKPVVNSLYAKKSIRIREGINGKLIFINK